MDIEEARRKLKMYQQGWSHVFLKDPPHTGYPPLRNETVMKTYTWEEKIENLVTLAKASGRLLDAEPGTDYAREAREKLLCAYDAFCDWRHEEPYVVDEIKAWFSVHNGTVTIETSADYTGEYAAKVRGES